jgi:GH25 family lysozyme M1 (1,4-beta-N-acetylmuramidase)
MLKGIDISHWQGDIDYNAVKSAVDFVILKVGGSDDGFYEDSRFREYLDGFKSVDMPILGAYYYVGSKFIGEESGIADADRLCDMLDGTGLKYAILDLESTDPDDKDDVTTAAIAFLNRCIARGYDTMIYGSDISTFANRVDITRLEGFKKWVARYGSEPSYVSNYTIWQYQSDGEIDGINAYVDMDYLYDDSLLGVDIVDNVDNVDEPQNAMSWTQASKIVDALYEVLLKRFRGDGENESLISALVSGELSRIDAFNIVIESDEYKKKRLIRDCYLVMRGSEPSDDELIAWLNTDDDNIKGNILYSEEFNNNYIS